MFSLSCGFLRSLPAATEGPFPVGQQGMNPLEQESPTAVMCQAGVGPELHLICTWWFCFS